MAGSIGEGRSTGKGAAGNDGHHATGGEVGSADTFGHHAVESEVRSARFAGDEGRSSGEGAEDVGHRDAAGAVNYHPMPVNPAAMPWAPKARPASIVAAMEADKKADQKVKKVEKAA